MGINPINPINPNAKPQKDLKTPPEPMALLLAAFDGWVLARRDYIIGGSYSEQLQIVQQSMHLKACELQ